MKEKGHDHQYVHGAEHSYETTHTHVLPDGRVYTHTHEEHHGEHGHSHGHTHDPKEMKKILNRLSRAAGHLSAVRAMIERGEDCSDVLVQLAAVRAEINNAGKALLKEHLEHCITEAIAENDRVSIDKMEAAIDRFMK